MKETLKNTDTVISARQEARENATALASSLAGASGLDVSTFELLAKSASTGSMTAKIPSKASDANMEQTVLKRAIDTLFEEQLAAWHTSKGWIYTRVPRNPETKRPLTGELRMTEKALREQGGSLYKVYFTANDIAQIEEPRHQWKTLSEWRAGMASQVAPAAAVAPALKSQSARRVR